LEWREAGEAALLSNPPPDCREDRWAMALRGLHRFIAEGWADRAALMDWTRAELYRVPTLWSRVDLAGAALLIGDRRVIAVTESNIVLEASEKSRLKFRRVGRAHLA
jgi:hypothetical protein